MFGEDSVISLIKICADRFRLVGIDHCIQEGYGHIIVGMLGIHSIDLGLACTFVMVICAIDARIDSHRQKIKDGRTVTSSQLKCSIEF